MKSELPRNASDKTQYVPLLGSTAILSHRLHQHFPTLCFSSFSVPLIAFLQLWTRTVAIGREDTKGGTGKLLIQIVGKDGANNRKDSCSYTTWAELIQTLLLDSYWCNIAKSGRGLTQAVRQNSFRLKDKDRVLADILSHSLYQQFSCPTIESTLSQSLH